MVRHKGVTMSEETLGIYVQEGQALAALLGGQPAKARAILGRLSEGQLEALTWAAGELADLAERDFDTRLDVRPLADPESGLAELLGSEGFADG